MYNRRYFLKKIPTQMAMSSGNVSVMVLGCGWNTDVQSEIHISDQGIVFSNTLKKQTSRFVSSDFIFSQFLEISEVLETIPMEIQWRTEITAAFLERSLIGSEMLNESIDETVNTEFPDYKLIRHVMKNGIIVVQAGRKNGLWTKAFF